MELRSENRVERRALCLSQMETHYWDSLLWSYIYIECAITNSTSNSNVTLTYLILVKIWGRGKENRSWCRGLCYIDVCYIEVPGKLFFNITFAFLPSDHSWYWLSDEYSLSQEKLNDTCLEPKLTHPIKTNSDLEHTQSSMITTSKRVGLYLDLLQYFFESEERKQQ